MVIKLIGRTSPQRRLERLQTALNGKLARLDGQLFPQDGGDPRLDRCAEETLRLRAEIDALRASFSAETVQGRRCGDEDLHAEDVDVSDCGASSP
ncbi:MAG TPA: hypothetical protein H9903_05200 [Candidatus Aquabacterium excrementipullorum]|nr:hypothetical protein [Candidatus Aquabacterium excrementipullorum]